jgi:hypothetical protein
MTSTSREDFLDQDDKIRGQNYVCMSFISPEDILKKKELFLVENYLKDVSTSLSELVGELSILFPGKEESIRLFQEKYDLFFKPETIQSGYKFFLSKSTESLEKQFHEENDFTTSIRGFKVRGSYDTLVEAKHRSELLRKKEDNAFNIFIAEVGCWCPWSPDPDVLKDQEFSETHLNTLMQKYHENAEHSQQVYSDRKEELKTKIAESNLLNTMIEEVDEVDEVGGVDETTVTDELQKKDAWSERKDETSSDN